MNYSNAMLATAREELSAMNMVPVVVVISTQQRENYGAHEWNGEGECPQYWKAKFGATYIVEGYEAYPDMLADSATGIELDALSKVSDAIEQSDHAFEEYIIGVSVREADKATQCYDEWETPTFIKPDGDILRCRETLFNGEYGYLRSDVEKIERSWDEDFDGNRSNFTEQVTYR